MARWALIQGGRIANIIEASAKPAGAWVEVQGAFGPGDLYDGQAFSKATSPRHITPLAFRNRFTSAEKTTYAMAASAQTADGAALRAAEQDVLAARFIDLDKTETRQRVMALESAGVLNAGRALQILDAPITDDERP